VGVRQVGEAEGTGGHQANKCTASDAEDGRWTRLRTRG
jgi:hypothetical protein